MLVLSSSVFGGLATRRRGFCDRLRRGGSGAVAGPQYGTKSLRILRISATRCVMPSVSRYSRSRSRDWRPDPACVAVLAALNGPPAVPARSPAPRRRAWHGGACIETFGSHFETLAGLGLAMQKSLTTASFSLSCKASSRIGSALNAAASSGRTHALPHRSYPPVSRSRLCPGSRAVEPLASILRSSDEFPAGKT